MNNLVLRDFNVFYGDFQAVKNVQLEVPEGQIVALLGGSGSGKSSLLRGVAGLETVVGELRFGDENLLSTPVYRRQFGLMFQDGQLFGHRTVAGNIEFGLRGFTRAEKQARTAELLQLVGLQGFEKRRISTLSGGQQQRVALARALAPRPRLLLLDEPLSALDRGLREQLALEIRRVVKEQGLTAIYVTHDQQEAFTVADRILLMDSGRILRDASPLEIWRDPQYLQVARFLGFSPLLSYKQAQSLGVDFFEGGELRSDFRNHELSELRSVTKKRSYVAFAPGAFEIAERNTPSWRDRNKENLIFAEILQARMGRGVADLEVCLLDVLGNGGKPMVFQMVVPLEVLEAEGILETQSGRVTLREGEVRNRRVTLRVRRENVCLVTEVIPQ